MIFHRPYFHHSVSERVASPNRDCSKGLGRCPNKQLWPTYICWHCLRNKAIKTLDPFFQSFASWVFECKTTKARSPAMPGAVLSACRE